MLENVSLHILAFDKNKKGEKRDASTLNCYLLSPAFEHKFISHIWASSPFQFQYSVGYWPFFSSNRDIDRRLTSLFTPSENMWGYILFFCFL